MLPLDDVHSQHSCPTILTSKCLPLPNLSRILPPSLVSLALSLSYIFNHAKDFRPTIVAMPLTDLFALYIRDLVERLNCCLKSAHVNCIAKLPFAWMMREAVDNDSEYLYNPK